MFRSSGARAGITSVRAITEELNRQMRRAAEPGIRPLLHASIAHSTSANGETMEQLAEEYECGVATIWRTLRPFEASASA